MLLVKHTPMALGIPPPQLNQQSLYRHSARLPSILHQFAGHLSHAPLSLKYITPVRRSFFRILSHLSRLARSCTSSVRLIRQPENRVKYASFITCARRGFYHGLRAVFLSASADRPSVAVLYAPLGVAIRARHPWLDTTPISAATPQAPMCRL